MLERFTRNARAVVVGAQEAASRAGASAVRPAHLLESLASADGVLAMAVLADLGAPGDEVRRVVRGLGGRHPDGLDAEDAEALRLLGIDLDEVIGRIERDLGAAPAPARRGAGRLRFSREAKKVLELALREAVRLHDGFIGTEHVLLGLLRQGDAVTLAVLEAFDLDAEDVRTAVDRADRRAG